MVATGTKRWLDSTEGIEMLFPTRDVRGNPFSINARIGSKKNGASADAESMLEHDFLTLLEWDPRVEQFGVQPVTVRWLDERGLKRRYTPDVLVRYHYLATHDDRWLQPTIFEVKPREVLRNQWGELRPRFRAAVGACRDAGMRFRIVTDVEIRTPLLRNARFLLQYKTTRYAMPTDDESAMLAALKERLRQLSTSTPRALLDSLTRDQAAQARYIPWLWHLINSMVIACDLRQPLTMTSAIWHCANKPDVFRGGWE